jgi:hypothetical protein
MTVLFEVEDFTRKIDKVTGSQDDDFVASGETKSSVILGYFQPSPFGNLRAGSSTSYRGTPGQAGQALRD